MVPVDCDPRLAWMVGLFEGEGCLGRHKVGNDGLVCLTVGIEMTDEDVVEAFVGEVRRLGIRTKVKVARRRRANPEHKDTFVWHLVGSEAERLFWLLEPYLGERRRLRGREIIAERERNIEERQKPRLCATQGCGKSFIPSFWGGSAQRFCSRECLQRDKDRRPHYRLRANERNRRYKLRQAIKKSKLPGQESMPMPGTPPHVAVIRNEKDAA